MMSGADAPPHIKEKGSDELYAWLHNKLVLLANFDFAAVVLSRGYLVMYVLLHTA